MKTVRISDEVVLGDGLRLVLIAGPCVVESQDLMMDIAGKLVTLAAEQQVPLVFKASYEKDNRTLADAYRGPGLEQGLAALAAVRERFGCPVLTDIHRVSDVGPAADVVDVLQVPALLSRQTSLLEEVGRAGRAVNLKKGQFMSPKGMVAAAAKVRGAGQNRVMLTERGTSFGYDQLVCDLTSITAMQQAGCPVLIDATHAANKREDVPRLACAGVAAGAAAVYLECHPDPTHARCEDKRMLSPEQLRTLLPQLVKISEAVRGG